MYEPQTQFTAVVALGLYKDAAVLSVVESFLPGFYAGITDPIVVQQDINELGAIDWFDGWKLQVDVPESPGIYLVEGGVYDSGDETTYSDVKITPIDTPVNPAQQQS